MNFNFYIFPLATHLGMSHKNNSTSLFIHEQFSIGNDKNMIDTDTKYQIKPVKYVDSSLLK